ncbi:MAG TPA: oligosaccharide flippase family protein [Phenylobacterium sp.]|uniref:oligosaccharide flippase family protein n=1 Tax=Phenylobacterium sp. TaxID=1871053 RepID=UPI002B4A5441|nr:oligosaccharide flippase family protein [Phenylobacterium sp.]HKR89283.1 oligosaccharide flippase family protein [Phenylobacterium sp.]
MQLPELFAHAGRAAFWAALAKWFDLVGGALTFLCMVRLLRPDDFGVYGLALLVILAPETIVAGALSESLIQRADLRPGHAAATTLLQLAIAPVLGAGLAVAAPWIAGALGHAELRTLVPLMAATLILLALAATPAALLQRDLRFRAIAVVDAAGTLTAAAVGLTMAFTGHGVWSLAWMEVARRAVRAIGFLAVAGWPTVWPSKAEFADLTHFNLTSLAMRLMIQADSAVPRLFLGVASASALGYFNLAQRIFQQFSALFIAPFNGIALPVASRIQGERKKLHAALDGATRVSTLVAYPIFLGGAAIAPVAIPMLLGRTWAPATLAIQIMLLLGLRAATASFNGGVLRAVGKPGLQLLLVTIGVAINASIAPFAAAWGASAIAAVFLARGLVTWALGAMLLQRVVGYPATRQFSIGWESMASAIVMTAVVSGARLGLGDGGSGPIRLAGSIVLGAATYALTLRVLAPATVRVFTQIALALCRRDRAGAAALAYAWAQPST